MKIEEKIFSNKCSDFVISSGNGDANCFRISWRYAKRLIIRNPSLCNDCVYNEEL